MMKSASLWRRQSWSKLRWNVKRLPRPILGPNFRSIFGRNWHNPRRVVRRSVTVGLGGIASQLPLGAADCRSCGVSVSGRRCRRGVPLTRVEPCGQPGFAFGKVSFDAFNAGGDGTGSIEYRDVTGNTAKDDDPVDADAALGVFERHAARQADHAMLGGVIGSKLRPAGQPANRRAIAPLPCFRICKSSCFTQAQTPRSLMAFTRSNASAG